MKKSFKKSLILLFTLSLFSTSCSIKKNKITKPEINNQYISPIKKEVSARGKVLCFERAQKEKNAFLSETAYKNCLLTIDENLKEFDKKQADLYFLDKKEDKKTKKTKSEIKKARKQAIKKAKKNKEKRPVVVNAKKQENNCKEGSIAGGAIGAGIGLATTKGKDRFWAVPAAGVAGALIGCQIDGG